MGADDYIAKPFRPRELVSRIRSVLRRCGKSQAVVTLGNVTVDTEKGVATKGGNDLYLSALEYRLLLVFVNNRGKVLSRQQAPRGDLGRRRGLCQRQHAHRLHQAPAREDRGRPAESPDHPHRAGKWAIRWTDEADEKTARCSSCCFCACWGRRSSPRRASARGSCRACWALAGGLVLSGGVMGVTGCGADRAIAQLNQDIDRRAARGRSRLPIVSNDEGELAILRSEVGKMTIRLREAADSQRARAAASGRRDGRHLPPAANAADGR